MYVPHHRLNIGDTRATSTSEHAYDMSHPNRGLFIIINNKKFSPRTQMNERTGTDMDAANLYTRFKELGFEVNIYSDLKAEDMLKVMIEGQSNNKHSSGPKITTNYFFRNFNAFDQSTK